jgi:hypothetical protein
LRRQLDERASQSPADDDLLDPFLAASAETSADRAVAGGYRLVRPLLDAAVVELVRGLPPQALVRGGDPKSPARAYVRARIPALPGRWPRPAVVGDMLDRLVAPAAPDVWRSLGGPRELESLGLRPEMIGARGLDSGLEWSMLLTERWLRHEGEA